jgi:hypothetical protein
LRRAWILIRKSGRTFEECQDPRRALKQMMIDNGYDNDDDADDDDVLIFAWKD